jgi:hypothetical protein
MLIEHRPRHLN